MSVKTRQRLIAVYSFAVRLVCAAVLYAGIFVAVFHFAYGIFGMFETVSKLVFWLHLLLWYFLYLFMSLPCIVIHEAGHLLGGLLTGYRFLSFRVLSFMLTRTECGLRLKRLKVAGTGGQCLMEPPPLKDGRFPFVLHLLFGPLANGVAFAAALAVILTHWAEWMYLWHPFASAALNLFLLRNLYYMLINGIPMRTRHVDNDGMQLFTLFKQPECARFLHHSMLISSLMTQGIPERDMPEELFEMPPEHLLHTSRGAAAAVLACAHRCDLGQYEDMRATISELLASNIPLRDNDQSLLTVMLMTAELLGENRQEILEPMMTPKLRRYLKAMSHNPYILAVQYMWALLHDDDASEAECIQKRFETVAKTYPYSEALKADRELMEKALTRWEQKSSNPAQTSA